MTHLEKQGFVFQYLCNVDPDFLCRRLCISRQLFLDWIRGRKPIDEASLSYALSLFGQTRDTFDFLCSRVN